jgi:hypothetical protein
MRRQTLLGAAIGAVPLLATWGAVQFTQPWAQRMGGSSAASHVQICSAAAASLGAFLAPILLHSLSRRVGYAVLCVTALIAAEFLFLGQDSLNTSFFVAVGITGFASAAFYGWLPLYLPELFPTRIRAAGQGFCYNAGRSLAGVGVLATTYLIDVKGHYPQASAIVCAVYFVGMVLAFRIPETRGKPLE